jgi:hypothetical protein
MQNEFLPYDRALKLKQLGFDEPCISHYTAYGKFSNDYSAPRKYNSEFELGSYISAPTYSQAFRWFREKYGLQHDITLTADKELTGFYVLIHKLDGLVFNEDDAVELDIETTNREEAELIILDKLIEIVETKQQEQ